MVHIKNAMNISLSDTKKCRFDECIYIFLVLLFLRKSWFFSMINWLNVIQYISCEIYRRYFRYSTSYGKQMIPLLMCVMVIRINIQRPAKIIEIFPFISTYIKLRQSAHDNAIFSALQVLECTKSNLWLQMSDIRLTCPLSFKFIPFWMPPACIKIKFTHNYSTENSIEDHLCIIKTNLRLYPGIT